jgi:ABC-2 type transport system permease protein
MQAYLTLTRRELATFFLSISGYVIIAGLALAVGLEITTLLRLVGSDPISMPITQLFFNTLLLWFIIIVTPPIITMRLFAVEKASGTFETLTTTPVSDMQIVAAKFTAAIVFFVIMWLPTLPCLFVVQHFANQPGALDTGTLCSMYLGVFLVGSFLVSIGCFASALTKSQAVAAMLSLVAGLALVMLNWLAQ